MRAADIIMKKRDGLELSREEIAFLVGGYVAGEIPDYQVSAWAMAVFFKGMTPGETAALTELMLRSGKTIDLSGIKGPFVDKHSTGGVGDKTSLILAPLAAALGIRDPMMSGRALGHTGGTLDKLEAIPGYRTSLSVDEFREILRRDGFAMTGQTAEIVPADRLLYALRDVTATVESIPLITASILSKKAAEGTEALVLDVKYGSGAFMKEASRGAELARSLVDTGSALGLKVTALLTDMDEPLGNKVGNFLEVEESLDCLEGRGPEDLMEVTLELAARMVMLGGKAENSAQGLRLCEETLKSGKPRELFLQNVKSQGGDPAKLLEMRGKYRSPHSAEIRAQRNGFISRIDAWKIGHASVQLGVGRNRTEDKVCPTAGVQFHCKRGSAVKAGDRIMIVWAADEAGLTAALPGLAGAVEYSDTAPGKRKLILREIS
ncbi:MAG: thymidine phosphorylase [Treponema sp.]|nr:thymidine phosphorylase [Treponema sp.]